MDFDNRKVCGDTSITDGLVNMPSSDTTTLVVPPLKLKIVNLCPQCRIEEFGQGREPLTKLQ